MQKSSKQQPNEQVTLWGPQEGPQYQFLTTNEFEALYGGAKGGGKSDALLFGALRQVSNPNYKAIIFRRTFTRLKHLIDRSKKTFPRLAENPKWNEVDHRWTFPSGATIEFGHCQHEKDKDNYQGQEYHYMGFDQLEEFTESIYTFFIANVRSADPTIRLMVRSSANPGGVGHGWVKRRFIDGKIPGQRYVNVYEIPKPDGEVIRVEMTSIFIPARLWDNKILLSSNPNYLASLMQLDEKKRKALLDGNWDVFEGQFFDMWNRDIHVIQPLDPTVLKKYRKFMMMDYGYSAPSAVYWALKDFLGRVIVYRELYQQRLTYEQLGVKIKEMTPPEERSSIGYFVIPHDMFERSRESGVVALELMKKGMGDFKPPLLPMDNERIAGWGIMRDYLKPYLGPDGTYTANLLFTVNCIDAIRTIPELIHDEVRPEDVNTEGEDHAGDAIRGGLKTLKIRPTETSYASKREKDDTEKRFAKKMKYLKKIGKR